MPIHCNIDFPRLSEDEMRTIDYAVMRHVFDTHNELGRLCDESVYQRGLLRRLQLAGIEASIEVPVWLTFREFSIQRSLDLVVAGKVIYELKTVAHLLKSHEGQLLEYLYLVNSNRGKLVNFRSESVESRYVNTTFDRSTRQGFQFDQADFTGHESLARLIRELVEDWGTGLSASLYRRAILGSVSGAVDSEQLLPMVAEGQAVGNQRFHLLYSHTGLGVTTYAEASLNNRRDFEKLIGASPLSELYWINIHHHHVRLVTIRKP